MVKLASYVRRVLCKSRFILSRINGPNKSRKPNGLFLKNIKLARKTLEHLRLPLARWSVVNYISIITECLYQFHMIVVKLFHFKNVLSKIKSLKPFIQKLIVGG